MMRNTPQPLDWAKAVYTVALLAVVFLVSLATAQAAQVTLAWNASNPSTGVAGYHVVYGTASKSYTTHLDAGNNTQLLVTGLEEGKTYYFAVHAHNADDSVSSANSTELPYTVPYAAPVANFNATTSGLTVNFTDVSTGKVTGWTWDFGDSSSPGNTQNPSHTYASVNTYTVKLTATGPGGSATATKIVTVQAAPPPVATLTLNQKTGPDPLTVIFTINCTGSNISSCDLDYGDGTSFSVPRTSTQSVNHNYPYRSTSYAVKLTVTGPGGSIVIPETITVTAAQPSAIFSATTTAIPLAVKLANASTGTVSTWSWTFGDGGVSSVQNPPDYTYKAVGTYEISLTATGPTGLKSTTKQSITVSAAKVDSGLVAAYNFEEASGATVVDASGKGYTGTLSGATRTTSGKFGSALSFDGVDDRISLGRSLDFSAPFTAEAWIYPTSYAKYRVILSKRDSFSPSDMRFDIGLNAGTGAVYVQDGTMRLASYAPPLNTWTHIAVTINTDKSISLYVNGALKQSLGTLSPGSDSAAQVLIGSTGDLDDPFQGRIDEVRIYNRALSATEIANEWNKAVSVTSPPKRLLGDVAGNAAASTQKGIPMAFQTTALAAGMVTSLPVYLDASSASTKLVVGLYEDNGGRPGALRAQGTLSLPTAGALNRVLLPATAVQANNTYWVAILSPSGVLKYKAGSVARPSVTSTKTSSSSLPSSWTTVSSTSGGTPAYGAGY